MDVQTNQALPRTLHKTEAGLLRAQTDLKLIYDNVPVMICLLDEDRRILYANLAFRSFIGLPEDRLPDGRACGVFGCINALDDPKGCGYGPACADCTLLKALTDTRSTGNGHHDIEKHMTLEQDGHRQDITLMGSTSQVLSGDSKNLLLCLTDITARKQAESALRESEEKFRSAFRTSPDSINLNRLEDGVYIDINEGFTQITGFTREEILGKSFLDFNIWNDPKDREHLVTGLKQHGMVENLEAEFRCKDGQIKTGLMSARLLNIGNKPVILSITRDISDIRQHEKDTQTLVETTVGKTGQELFDVAVAKLCEWLNCECAIVGEIIGNNTVRALSMMLDKKPVSNYTYSLKNSPCDETVRKCFCVFPENVSTLFPNDPDLIQMGAQGYVGTVLKGENNEIAGILCGISRKKLTIKKNTASIMNIIGSRISTEIIRLKSEKEKTALEIQIQQSQKMEAIGTLAGGIAHDFNNILFPIVGHTEMLLDDFPENSPIRNSLNEIHISALRAKDLIQQILSFSRQGKSELKLMKMQPIIKEALKLIRSTIPTTISIRQNLQSGCRAVHADPTQIHQIIMNLTTNAYHAMEESGGELRVTLKEIRLDKNDLLYPDMTPGFYACLTVSDTGTGMDTETAARIFEPFFTTKGKNKGTGMGLSVVQGIVKRMKGAVQVNSVPGRGTDFHVYLPVAGSSPDHPEPHDREPVPGGSERILLVDDERAVITLEKQILERLGYHVMFHTSSIDALETFRSHPDAFDLVITDLAMPKLPGDKLSAELIGIRPDIPILLCTGFCETMSEEKIKSLGIRGLLMKPIVTNDLARKIRDILSN